MVLDFGILSSNLFPQSDAAGDGLSSDIASQIVWNDVGVGIVPIGSVTAWCKNLPGTPPLLPNFVECNGQVLADGDSPLNGQTIPDLNASAGTARFLRGATTSGGQGGSETHLHLVNRAESMTAGGVTCADTGNTGASGTLPSYYGVVWIMRIK